MSLLTPKIFRELGLDVSELFCEKDPDSKCRPSDPKEPENIEKLSREVVSEGADFGVAFDMDGDRVVIVDGNGTAIDPNKMGIIIARDVLKKRPGPLIVNIECSMAVKEELKGLATDIITCPVGHVYLMSESKKHKASMGNFQIVM